MNCSVAMLLANSLHNHGGFAKCAWVGALAQIAFGFGVLCPVGSEVSCRRMWMTSVFGRRCSIRAQLGVLFLNIMGVLFVHRRLDHRARPFCGPWFRLRV